MFRVLGMDGCSVNTGIHNGAMRQVEVKLHEVVQHVVCGLHLVELMLWHILSQTDGVTKGPGNQNIILNSFFLIICPLR